MKAMIIAGVSIQPSHKAEFILSEVEVADRRQNKKKSGCHCLHGLCGWRIIARIEILPLLKALVLMKVLIKIGMSL